MQQIMHLPDNVQITLSAAPPCEPAILIILIMNNIIMIIIIIMSFNSLRPAALFAGADELSLSWKPHFSLWITMCELQSDQLHDS